MPTAHIYIITYTVHCIYFIKCAYNYFITCAYMYFITCAYIYFITCAYNYFFTYAYIYFIKCAYIYFLTLILSNVPIFIWSHVPKFSEPDPEQCEQQDWAPPPLLAHSQLSRSQRFHQNSGAFRINSQGWALAVFMKPDFLKKGNGLLEVGAVVKIACGIGYFEMGTCR